SGCSRAPSMARSADSVARSAPSGGGASEGSGHSARPLSAGSNGSHGVAETPISPKVDSGSEVPYWLREHSPVATLEDIYYCFRLLLGRSPGPSEWPGHSGRVGMNLVDVVRPYLTSLEFANRELFTEPNTEIELGSIEGFDIYFSTRDVGVGAAI